MFPIIGTALAGSHLLVGTHRLSHGFNIKPHFYQIDPSCVPVGQATNYPCIDASNTRCRHHQFVVCRPIHQCCVQTSFDSNHAFQCATPHHDTSFIHCCVVLADCIHDTLDRCCFGTNPDQMLQQNTTEYDRTQQRSREYNGAKTDGTQQNNTEQHRTTQNNNNNHHSVNVPLVCFLQQQSSSLTRSSSLIVAIPPTPLRCRRNTKASGLKYPDRCNSINVV